MKNTSGEPLQRGEFDLMKVFEPPEMKKYQDFLTHIKAFGFQRDASSCIPYCLFVAAMFNGLEQGRTLFKESGRKQFEQDFGVRIMTREDLIPKPRVRMLE